MVSQELILGLSLVIALVFLKATYSGFVPALEDHTSKMAELIGKTMTLENASEESDSEDDNLGGEVPTSDEEPRTEEVELTELSHS